MIEIRGGGRSASSVHSDLATPSASLTAGLASTLAEDLRSLPIIMTRGGIAALACCDEKTVVRAEERGELRPVRRSRGGSQKTLYSRADVLRWLGLSDLLSAPPAAAPRKRGRPRKTVEAAT